LSQLLGDPQDNAQTTRVRLERNRSDTGRHMRSDPPIVHAKANTGCSAYKGADHKMAHPTWRCCGRRKRQARSSRCYMPTSAIMASRSAPARADAECARNWSTSWSSRPP